MTAVTARLAILNVSASMPIVTVEPGEMEAKLNAAGAVTVQSPKFCGGPARFASAN